MRGYYYYYYFLSFCWFLNSRHGPQPSILKGLFSYSWDIIIIMGRHFSPYLDADKVTVWFLAISHYSIGPTRENSVKIKNGKYKFSFFDLGTD
jgi:hypothetical protein